MKRMREKEKEAREMPFLYFNCLGKIERKLTTLFKLIPYCF